MDYLRDRQERDSELQFWEDCSANYMFHKRKQKEPLRAKVSRGLNAVRTLRSSLASLVLLNSPSLVDTITMNSDGYLSRVVFFNSLGREPKARSTK